MTTRLNRQRGTTRTMPWDSSRNRRAERGGSRYPTDNLVIPNNVTPGTPGSFTPVGSAVPLDLADLRHHGALGETTAWTVGQRVVLGDGTNAHWDGNSWEAGAKPA